MKNSYSEKLTDYLDKRTRFGVEGTYHAVVVVVAVLCIVFCLTSHGRYIRTA